MGMEEPWPGYPWTPPDVVAICEIPQADWTPEQIKRVVDHQAAWLRHQRPALDARPAVPEGLIERLDRAAGLVCETGCEGRCVECPANSIHDAIRALSASPSPEAVAKMAIEMAAELCGSKMTANNIRAIPPSDIIARAKEGK